MTGAETAARTIRVVRHFIGRQLDDLQLRLDAFAASRDPAFKQWADETRAAVANGSIQRAIDAQPDPGEIIEQWLGSTPGS